MQRVVHPNRAEADLLNSLQVEEDLRKLKGVHPLEDRLNSREEEDPTNRCE